MQSPLTSDPPPARRPPAACFGRFVFAQTRDISMADQLKMGPGYVTGNESTMEEHAVYGDEQDASLGAALYSHTHAVSAAFGDVPQHTASGQDEGSFMGTSSLFSQPAPAAGGSSSGAAELLIDLGQGADSGGANTSGYMEIQPVASSKPSGGGGGGGGNPDLLLGPLDPLADFDVDGDNSSDGYMTVQPPQGPLIDGKAEREKRKRYLLCGRRAARWWWCGWVEGGRGEGPSERESDRDERLICICHFSSQTLTFLQSAGRQR